MVITAGAEAANAARANVIEPSALDEIAHSQDALDQLSETLQEKMKEFHKAQDIFESEIKKQDKLLKAIQASQRARAATQRKTRRVSSSSSSSSPHDSDNGDSNDNNANKLSDGEVEFANRLNRLKERLREGQKLMPRSGGTFVQLFAGCINVGFNRKSERLAFKSEYEMVKLKFAPFGVIFCLICLLLPDYRWIHMIFQLFLSWYYVTLAIRENILRINGSNIRPWWIVHHYITMMQGVLLLTWPRGESYSRFCPKLHVFGLYNAVLMIFQTRYQMARLYALRSLGRANEMDVASSDSTQIHWSETMTLLLPLVVLGQIMQGYISFSLYRIFSEFRNEMQILFLAFLFTANFVGNVTTTIQVMLDKRRTAKMAAPSPSVSSSQASSSQASSAASPALDPVHPKQS